MPAAPGRRRSPECRGLGRARTGCLSILWITPPDAQVQFDIKDAGSGCLLRWTLTDTISPGPLLAGHMCKRLNVFMNAELRSWQ